MKNILAELPPQLVKLDQPRAALVAGSLLLVAVLLWQFLPSRHHKAFLRLDGPANASWLLGTLHHAVASFSVLEVQVANALSNAGSWGAVLDNEAMSLTTQWTKQYGGAYRFGSFFGVSRNPVLLLLIMQADACG